MENAGNNNDSDEKLPEDFLRILQNLRAEIEQEERAVAEEKFLIEKYEARTKEHTAEINRTKKYNAELESMLKHLTNMHNTQMKHLESSKDVEELLRHQVKSKEEELYRLKEKHSEMKKECERKHDHYQEIYCERMLVYDSLPMVPEYKRQVARLEELQTVLHDKKRELEASKEELATIAAEQDVLKPAYSSLTEWGVSFAQTMQSITQNQIKSKSMKSVAELETEVQVLQAKKENILKKQEIERKSVFKAAKFKDLKPIAKSSS
uniref:Uncharacterized protein n=1 Tax=Ciona savignyi TaxID=51511 RepID=H2YN52_CIOSA